MGVDQSEAHVAWAAANVDDNRARFVVADAAHLPAVAVDVVVSGLVLNFLPDAGAALGAMCERAPAGVVAAYVWDYADRMDLMRHFWNVAVTLDPAADFDETVRFPICHPDRLRALWEDGGLTEVAVGAIDVPTVFRDFDDYWAPFLGGQGVAPAYVMSLDDQRRQELRERLRASVPVAGDGTVRLMARALAVRGCTGSARGRRRRASSRGWFHSETARPRWVAGSRCALVARDRGRVSGGHLLLCLDR